MNKIHFFLISCSLFLGCTKQNSALQGEGQEAVKVITLDAPTLPHNDKYADLYDSIRYVPLESNDRCLFSYLTKLEITSEGDFIVLDRQAKKVLRFDANGHFLNPIGEHGHGHNEFLEPFDIVYNQYDNTVWVADRLQSEILIYTLEGKMVDRIRSDYNLCAIDVIDPKHYCVYAGFIVSRKNEALSYNYNILCRDDTTAIHFDKVANNGSSPSAQNVFVHHKGKVYSRPLYSNNIYAFNANSVSKQYELHYSEPDQWVDFDVVSRENVGKESSKGKKHVKSINFSDKYLFLYVGHIIGEHYSTCLCIHDLDNDKDYWFSYDYNDMNPDAPMDYFFDKITETHTYSSIRGSSFDSYCQKKREAKDTLSAEFEYFKALSQNLNPILIVGKLK